MNHSVYSFQQANARMSEFKQFQPRMDSHKNISPRQQRSRLDRLLTPDQNARLQAIATVLNSPDADQTIYHEGQTADMLFMLNKGMVELTNISREGNKQIISFLRPGDLFGLSEHGHYCYTATTLTAAEMIQLPLDALRKLLIADAQMQLEFLTKAADDLRRSQRQIVVLGQHNVQQRLAVFLTEFLHNDEFYDPDQHVITLPMKRSNVAEYLATTPESVARALSAMEADGIIQRPSRSTIRVINMRALLHLAWC